MALRHTNYTLRTTQINNAKPREKAYVLTDGDSAYASQKALIGSKAPRAKDFTNQRVRKSGEINETLRAKNRNMNRPEN